MTIINPKHSGGILLTDIFSEDGYDEPIVNNYKPPINQYIESVNELGLDLSNDLTEKIVNEALSLVGMLEYKDRPPHHLSFGQRRRVAVATVLAMKPEILVLDEPSSNLDPASRRELADILRSLEITMIMVTHDLPYAYELCERSLILSGGVIAADGKTRELLMDVELLKKHRLEMPVGFTL